MPLVALAHYADTLIKTADRNVRSSKSLHDWLSLSAVKPNKLSADAAMLSDDDGQKNMPELLSKL